MFWLTFINGRQQHDTDLCQYITMCVLLIHYFMPGGPVQYSVHLGQSFWFAGCCSSTISLSEETLRFRAYMFSILSSYSRDYPRSLNKLIFMNISPNASAMYDKFCTLYFFFYATPRVSNTGRSNSLILSKSLASFCAFKDNLIQRSRSIYCIVSISTYVHFKECVILSMLIAHFKHSCQCIIHH